MQPTDTKTNGPRQSFLDAIKRFLRGEEADGLRLVISRRVRRMRHPRPRNRMAARNAKRVAARHKANKLARRNRKTNVRRQRPHTRKRG